MMHAARIPILLTMLLLVCGCSQSTPRTDTGLPDQRPGDFVLGLVVFGGGEEDPAATRSARYIIEPGGVLRASFGDGSDGLTYPPITREIDEATLDTIWAMISDLGVDSEPWRVIRAPEFFHSEAGSVQGYLLEIRADVRYASWTTPIETGPARELAEELASLAWIRD